MPEPPEKFGQEDLPRYAIHRGERMRVTGRHGKDHFFLSDKTDTRHIAHRKVLTFIKDAKIIKNAFGVIDKRKTSESRVKAVAAQDQQIAQMTQKAAAHHAQNRMPMFLTQEQRATIKSRKKVYGYHIKHGWGIHDKTEAVYPARKFYNTAAKPGMDPRRRDQKPVRVRRAKVDNTTAETS